MLKRFVGDVKSRFFRPSVKALGQFDFFDTERLAGRACLLPIIFASRIVHIVEDSYVCDVWYGFFEDFQPLPR